MWYCLIAASEFAPDITIISAGFDAARGDPLGCCDVRTASLQPGFFVWYNIYLEGITQLDMHLANIFC